MRWIGTPIQNPGASARRVGIHVVVIGVHVALLLGVLHDLQTTSVKARRRPDDRRSLLQIRLIPQPLAAPTPAPPALSPPSPARKRPSPLKHHAVAVQKTATTPLTPETARPHPADPAAIAPPASRRPAANYVPGGNLFSGRNEPHPSPARLPGSGTAIVQGLHMVDPRSQGIAGVARGLQGLFGLVDSHCYDVDAWRGMSMRELVAHHLTPARVEQVAARYHCGVTRESHAKNLAEPLQNVYDVTPGN